MATVYVSPIATDMSATASYLSAIDGATTGSLPSAGDTLIFYGGRSEITAGHAALAAIDLAEVIFLPSCQQTCSTPLQLMVSHSGGPGKLTYKGSGAEFQVMADGDGIDESILQPMAGRLRISSDGAVNWTRLVVAGGTVVAEATARTPDWTVSGGKFMLVDGTAATTGRCVGGTTEDYRGCATVRLLKRGAVYRNIKDAAVSSLLQLADGVANLQSTGTIAKLEASGGILTPEGCPGSVTITNADFIGTTENGPVIYEEVAGSKVVFTNTPVVYGTVSTSSKSSGGTTNLGAGA
jgi:hypothetical protein